MAKLERKPNPAKKENPYAQQAKEQQKAEVQRKQDTIQKNLKVSLGTHAKISALASMKGDKKVYELVTEAIEQYVAREVNDKDRGVFEYLVEKALEKDN